MAVLIDVVPGSPEWLAARRSGVTATDVAVVCGLSSWDSPYSLYWRKLGVVPDVIATDRMRLGLVLEPYIAERWRSANTVGFDNLIPGSLYASSDRSWQMATTDRMLVTGHPHGEPVELKTSAVKDGWGPDGTDQVPVHVRAQVLWQMDTLDASRGHVGCLFLPSGELRSYVIEHDESYIPDGPDVEYPCPACKDIKLMREAGYYFHTRVTDGNNPPDLDSSAATLAALKARFAPVVAPERWEMDTVAHGQWAEYERAKEKEAHWKKVAREFEAVMRERAGHAGEWCLDGEVVARRLRYPVKEHVRKAGMVDKVMRVKAKEEDSDTANGG